VKYVTNRLNEILDLEATICHYTSADTCIKYILHKNRLWLPRITSTKDPLEKRPRKVDFSGYDQKLLGPEEYSRLVKETSEIQWELNKTLEDIRIGCFTMNGQNFDPNHGSLDKVCFLNPKMWVEYGKAQTGVAILFHRAWIEMLALKEPEVDEARKVTYHPFSELSSSFPRGSMMELREQGREEYIRKRRKAIVDRFAYRKHLSFEVEREFRYSRLSMVKEEEYLDLGTSIAGIVVSENISDFDEKYLQEYCDERKIPQLFVRWNSRTVEVFKAK